jgi:hypothetical protein
MDTLGLAQEVPACEGHSSRSLQALRLLFQLIHWQRKS